MMLMEFLCCMNIVDNLIIGLFILILNVRCVSAVKSNRLLLPCDVTSSATTLLAANKPKGTMAAATAAASVLCFSIIHHDCKLRGANETQSNRTAGC